MVLARDYRFVVENDSGDDVEVGSVKIDAKRWNFDQSGVLTYEGSETEVYANGAIISDGAVGTGGSVDNSSDLFIGGDFNVTVTGAAAPDGGSVFVYYETSTDGGVTFPGISGIADNEGDIVVSVPVQTGIGNWAIEHFSL